MIIICVYCGALFRSFLQICEKCGYDKFRCDSCNMNSCKSCRIALNVPIHPQFKNRGLK